MNYHWTEYHGLAHQVDEQTGDSPRNLMFLRYDNSDGCQNKKLKIHRLCFFEPAEDCTDYDDPTQYELKADYIPVMRNSDGKFGLYERITNETFYGSTVGNAQFQGPTYE